MADIIPLVTKVLSLLTSLVHILFLAMLFGLSIKYFSEKERQTIDKFFNFFNKHKLVLGLILALISTLGSLFFSEIANYSPCELCWFQRIFMYPLVILFIFAIFKRDKGIMTYVLPLSLIGAFISGYHYLSSTFKKIADSGICSAIGNSSCLVQYFKEFGYITLPLMALTAFIAIIVLSLLDKKNKVKEDIEFI